MPPNKDHKRMLELLYGLIAVTVIIWAIIYIQIKNATNYATSNGADVAQERNQSSGSLYTQIINDFNKSKSSNPPLTEEQKKNIVSDFNKNYNKVPPLTQAEKIKIVESFNSQINK